MSAGAPPPPLRRPYDTDHSYATRMAFYRADLYRVLFRSLPPPTLFNSWYADYLVEKRGRHER